MVVYILFRTSLVALPKKQRLQIQNAYSSFITSHVMFQGVPISLDFSIGTYTHVDSLEVWGIFQKLPMSAKQK